MIKLVKTLVVLFLGPASISCCFSSQQKLVADIDQKEHWEITICPLHWALTHLPWTQQDK